MKRVVISKRSSIFLVLAVAALLAPMTWAGDASGSNDNAAPQLQGPIESVTPTNFSIKTRARHRRLGRLTAIVVHYNPETVQMTVDGVAMRTIDVRQTGKYAVVEGTIVNGVLEATTITITADPPQRRSKSRS